MIEQSFETRISPIKSIRNKNSILVHEIYASLQGESTFVGEPCVFIRTTGCHLRCTYCDTEQAFFNGAEYEIDAIINEVKKLGIRLVEVTGGEPLLQRPVFDLLTRLCNEGFQVLLETSGGVSIAKVDRRVHVILDVKTPSSGEADRNIWSNLKILWPLCEVKFVIGDENDYEFSKKMMNEHHLTSTTKVLFSPAYQKMSDTQLADWIIRDRLPIRFQVQLHKVLWGNKTGV